MERSAFAFLVVFAGGTSVGLGCSSGSTPLTPVRDAGVDVRVDAPAQPSDGGADATLGPPKHSWEASLYDGYVHIPDALPDVAVVSDDANCVAPGTASNAVGVGGYCSPGGGQCDNVGIDASTTLCTADFGAPAHAWFCTIPCTVTNDCGEGTATCVPAAGGLACVPAACGLFGSDASVDGAADAGTSSDADRGDGGDASDAHADADGSAG